MKLVSLDVAGFGRLVDRHFTFAPGLNVVFGLNESGKSTLANAIVATLYGAERRKEAWRPWNAAAPFGTTLVYELENGERIEVQRDFERDAKGLRAYDRAGNDVSAKGGNGKKFVPGDAHLQMPLEVFVNAACVKQQFVAIEAGKPAQPLAAHLAQALDGSPQEDTALDALQRLDDALRAHVGTDRMRKSAPLRALRDRADAQAAEIAGARRQLASLEDLRARIVRSCEERDAAGAAVRELERKLRAVRAATIEKQLAALRAFRDDAAHVQAELAAYDDVATFPAERERELNDAYYAWESADRSAADAAAAAADAEPAAAERNELDARRGDAGALDDVAFAALADASAGAERARQAAAAAANDAAAARRDGAGGGVSGILGGVLAAGAGALAAAVAFAIAHLWPAAIAALAVATVLLVFAFAQGRERAARRREADRRQRVADDAAAAEQTAARAIAAVLEPLHVPSVEELARRRERLAELAARDRNAARLAERASTARAAATEAGRRFDAVAAAMLPGVAGERAQLRAAAAARAARKAQRNGLDARLRMLEMQRSTLVPDDEYALEAELRELLEAGTEPLREGPTSVRQIEAERDALAERRRLAGETVSRLQGERANAESHVPDLAALDEELARTQAEIARLEAFVERFRAKATKAKQAQSRVKRLDKIERIVRDPRDRAG
ncbi:MAG: AAA family ATPase, partial [Candidatus Velthaea sp.]